MEKIPTLFERDWNGDRSRVLPIVAKGCEWVLEGEGVATRKYDGTCMMYDRQGWFARRELRRGQPAPDGFRGVAHDEETGKTVGWQPVAQSPFVKFWREAVAQTDDWEPGTYELVGPKIQGNPEGYETHQLIGHAGAEQVLVIRDFEGMRAGLAYLGWEGFVFHHPDGRMAKIKGRDFGLRRV